MQYLSGLIRKITTTITIRVLYPVKTFITGLFVINTIVKQREK